MSKFVKGLISDIYKNRFAGVDAAIVIDFRGVASNDVNVLRAELAAKGIKISVVKNNLVKGAIGGSDMAPLSEGLAGASAFVYATNPETSLVVVARELVDKTKKLEALKFKAAWFDGTMYKGEEEVIRLSKFPTRIEAQGQLVTLATSPGSRLLGIIEVIAEKLEKGETITKVG